MAVDRSVLGDLYPFESHYLNVPGGRLHYVDEGTGRPIVMLHGNPTWSFYYRDLIKGLRSTRRVIVPDHIGCGLSDKPQQYPYTLASHIENVERLIEHLGIEDITLLVHDWGGPIGFGWAAQHLEDVRDLVVLNTSAFVTHQMPFRIRICGWPILGPVAILGLNAFARAAVRQCCCHRERMTPQVAAGYLLPYDSIANRVAILSFVRDIPYGPNVPSFRVLQAIESALPSFCQKPMQIFWGLRDFCFTEHFLRGWEERFPEAVVHRYEDAGHYVVEDAHERILERLLTTPG